MTTVRFSRLLYVGLLLILTACQAAGQSLSDAMIQPGDKINGMNLTTGAKDAPPLWAFCSPIQQAENVIITNCELPVLSKLGVGDLFALAGGKLDGVDWSALRWELFLDDRSLDLNAFGTFDYVTPILPGKPSPLTEVFKKFKAWDVVLTNLVPGEHNLHGFAHNKSDRYIWLIHLTIKADTVAKMDWNKVGLEERP
jgi:hypothetical protein